jgi:hypothetical protein
MLSLMGSATEGHASMTSASSITGAFHQLIIEPIRNRSSAQFWLQICAVLNDRFGGSYDELIAQALRKRKVALPTSQLMTESDISNCVEILHNRGWDILPFQLSKDDVADLQRFALSTMPHPPRYYRWPQSDLIRVPAIQKLLTDSALHRIAQDYLNSRPILTSVQLGLETSADKIKAYDYHYDNDGPKFLKFYMYIADTDRRSGPHYYIQGTHPHRKSPPFDRAGLFFDRDELLKRWGEKNEIVFTGPAGMIWAEDTAGFHRGSTPNDYRLLFQIQYAIIDIPTLWENKTDKIAVPGVDPHIRQICRKFLV